MGGYLIVLSATVGTTLLLTPLVRRLAVRFGAVVAPDERRVHARPTPTLGGVAMYGGLLAGLATATVERPRGLSADVEASSRGRAPTHSSGPSPSARPRHIVSWFRRGGWMVGPASPHALVFRPSTTSR